MKFRLRALDIMVLVGVVGCIGWWSMHRPQRERNAFAEQINLDPLYQAAVQSDGRIRSFESHAKSFVGLIAGSRKINGQSDGFTYLDLIFRPEAYHNKDIIQIKNKLVRAQIVDASKDDPQFDEERSRRVIKDGLVSPAVLKSPRIVELLGRLSKDLIRTAKTVDQIQTALAVSDAHLLASNLRVLVPENATPDTPWVSMDQLVEPMDMPQDSTHVGVAAPAPVPGIDALTQQAVRETWSRLAAAWRSEDASSVNQHVAQLAERFRSSSPLYPSAGRLHWESWYFRYNSMTWVWLIYLLSLLPLLMSVIYRWDRAHVAGMILFVVAFAFHTASLGVRWYISGRWPNSNMFEAVTTSAWFGGVGALLMEWFARRSPLRNVFALASAILSMISLMAAYFLPAALDSTIRNKMAALNDVWLYIHTNVIIWSYAVIGLACVPALLLLRDRWCRAWDAQAIPRGRLLLLPVALAVLNASGWYLLMHLLAPEASTMSRPVLLGLSGAFWGSLSIVTLELLARRSRIASGGRMELSASGGAATLLSTSSGGGFLGSGASNRYAGIATSGAGSFLRPVPTASQIFDGATMVAVEVAFIMLFTGTVMGAIWADHSWGRPWGWDPKEVFALNTFIIFLILVHVRLKVRDKAFWTAVLAVIGFEVMLFNWIVVNFVITGLHSYA